MITSLKKLLSGPAQLPEIAALRKALAENKADIDRLLDWGREVQANPELNAMLNEFGRDISNRELGEKIIKLWVSLDTEQEPRMRLHQIASPQVRATNEARTRAALKPALQAVIARLESELDTVNEHDRKHAEQYGIAHEQGPVARQVATGLDDARQKLTALETAGEMQLGGIVAFVLGASK